MQRAGPDPIAGVAARACLGWRLHRPGAAARPARTRNFLSATVASAGAAAMSWASHGSSIASVLPEPAASGQPRSLPGGRVEAWTRAPVPDFGIDPDGIRPLDWSRRDCDGAGPRTLLPVGCVADEIE